MTGFLRIAKEALAVGALSIACSASAPQPTRPARPARPALPRLSWHPRAGAGEIDCASPRYDCDRVGLEKCEAECAEGEMPDCTALGEWQGRNPGKGGDPARGLSLLRFTCEKGFGLGCVSLAADPAATARDRAMITATLAPACARGDVCGCSLYGSALTFDAQGSARGVELLGGACGGGAVDACDTLAFLSELCERDPAHGGYCARIRADTRPPWSPPPWPAAELPASLEGCFRVAEQVETPDGERCVAVATAKANGWLTERGYVCPEDGSFDKGALYCFLHDRYFVKPPRAPWDAHPARWSARPDRAVFRLRLLQVREEREVLLPGQGYLEELRPLGRGILAVGDGVAARLERLSRPEERAARRELSALPTLEEACERAYRCSLGVFSGGSQRRPPTGLGACLAEQEEIRAIGEKKMGKEAAKEACP